MIAWMEKELQREDLAVVLVSHDRCDVYVRNVYFHA